jgi:hypothetical protein
MGRKLLTIKPKILGDLAFGDSFGCLELDVLHVCTLHRCWWPILIRAAMDFQYISLHQRWGVF